MEFYQLVDTKVYISCDQSDINWSAQSDYDGLYAGSYTGDDDGYWVAVLDASGVSAFLSYSSTYDEGDVGELSWRAEGSGAGNYWISYTEIQGTYADVYINAASGGVTGNWENSPLSGTFSGEKITTSSYAGTYSGKFKGDESGTWELTITSDGYITGTAETSEGIVSFEGICICHPDGNDLTIGDTGESVFGFFGQIDGVDISGIRAADDGSEGTFGPSGGGGGGGCFISTLLH